ncbi:hypothetical protein ACWEDZ_25730 [Streptomyces sp. NPDC005047]
MLDFWQKTGTYGSKIRDEAGAIANLENSMVARAVRGLSDPARAASAISGTSGLVGVGTGGFGLYGKAVDADDSRIKDGTVAGIDGSRLVLDSGSLVGIVRHVFGR